MCYYRSPRRARTNLHLLRCVLQRPPAIRRRLASMRAIELLSAIQRFVLWTQDKLKSFEVNPIFPVLREIPYKNELYYWHVVMARSLLKVFYRRRSKNNGACLLKKKKETSETWKLRISVQAKRKWKWISYILHRVLPSSDMSTQLSLRSGIKICLNITISGSFECVPSSIGDRVFSVCALWAPGLVWYDHAIQAGYTTAHVNRWTKPGYVSQAAPTKPNLKKPV